MARGVIDGCLRTIGLAVVVIIAIAVLANSDGCSNSRDPTSVAQAKLLERSAEIAVGTQAIVACDDPDATIPVQLTLEDLKAVVHAVATRDEQGEAAILRQSVNLQRGTRVLVTDKEFLYPFGRKVRVLEGPHEGLSGWVWIEWLHTPGQYRSQSETQTVDRPHLLDTKTVEWLIDPKNEEAIKEIGAIQREGFRVKRPPGSIARLKIGAVGRTPQSRDKISDASEAGGDYRAVWAKEIMEMPKGTRVTVIENDGKIVHLRILDGPFEGKEGWTYYSYLGDL